LLRLFTKSPCAQKSKTFTLTIALLCISTPISAAESFQPDSLPVDTQNYRATDPIEPAIMEEQSPTAVADSDAAVNPVAVADPDAAENLNLTPEPRAIAFAAPTVSKLVSKPASNPMIVDNDDEKTKDSQPKESARWQETIDTQGNAHLETGVRFPIVAVSSLSSRTAKIGDRMEARLKADLKINGRLIAPKGTIVVGHVSSTYKARRLLVAEVSLHRAMRANGALGITFDAIVTEDGALLPLVAKPARQARIVKNHNEGRVLGVNHNGEIAAPLSTLLKHQGEHLAIRGAAAVGGVFTMGAVPVLFGVLGAMNPSFAFMQPVGNNVSHRRLKGFGMGVLSGLPGGFVVADFFIRGVEAQVKPGDEFLVELHQNFTGEPNTSAEIVQEKTKSVKGEVLNKQKPQK
jgi:hypothetical protein